MPAIWSLVAGIVPFIAVGALIVIALTADWINVPAEIILLLGFSSFLVAPLVAIVLGLVAVNAPVRNSAKPLGKGMAVSGLVLGLVHVTVGWIVYPFLMCIVCAITAEPASCCDCYCGDCGCGDCGCGDCGCGSCDCSGCDCGGGCCATATKGKIGGFRQVMGSLLTNKTWDSLAKEDMDRFLAHHPEGKMFDRDVYKIRGLRFCIGCFTVYPTFLIASLVVLALHPIGIWWQWMTIGIVAASFQLVSSFGLARWKWSKVLVKTLLGLGLSAIVYGVLTGPWPAVGKAGILLLVLLASLASAVPRGIRMKRMCKTNE